MSQHRQTALVLLVAICILFLMGHLFVPDTIGLAPRIRLP